MKSAIFSVTPLSRSCSVPPPASTCANSMWMSRSRPARTASTRARAFATTACTRSASAMTTGASGRNDDIGNPASASPPPSPDSSGIGASMTQASARSRAPSTDAFSSSRLPGLDARRLERGIVGRGDADARVVRPRLDRDGTKREVELLACGARHFLQDLRHRLVGAHRAADADEELARRPGERRQRFRLTAMLLAVHAAVGGGEERLHAVAVARERRDAEAAQCADRGPLEPVLAELRVDAVGDADGLFSAEPGEQQCELVAAQTRRGRTDGPGGGEDARGLAEHHVAELMTERVVQHLEVVEVGDDQADGPPLEACEVDLLLDERVEGAQVEQAGQRVLLGHLAQSCR